MIEIIILSFLSGITTVIGAILAIFFGRSRRGIVFGLSFSAGIMIIISIFDILLISLGNLIAILSFLLGIIFIAIINNIIPHTHVEEETHGIDLRSAYLIALGLLLHDFPEGFAMADSYFYSRNLGILLAIAIAIHNIPEEFAISIPFVFKKSRKDLIKIAFLSALAEPLGAIFGIIAAAIFKPLILSTLAFSGGIMLFISFHEMIPNAVSGKDSKMVFFGLFSGILVQMFLHMVL